MRLMATKAIRYGGRTVAEGEEFEASARDARVLKAMRRAVDAKPVEAAQPPPADGANGEGSGDSAAEQTKTKGSYKRRDMQAEQP